jgi:hypothetical protein
MRDRKIKLKREKGDKWESSTPQSTSLGRKGTFSAHARCFCVESDIARVPFVLAPSLRFSDDVFAFRSGSSFVTWRLLHSICVPN